ncbi:MAG: hypothetical protein WBE89_03675 [Methyloceanibacter sp.]
MTHPLATETQDLAGLSKQNVTNCLVDALNPPRWGSAIRRMLRSMRNPEINTKLTTSNSLEKLAGMHHAYETTIDDGVSEVVGRGPTPEASHEAAQAEWELAQLFDYGNSAAMFP